MLTHPQFIHTQMFILIFLLLVTQYSHAQNCSQIQDKLERLECYDSKQLESAAIDIDILKLRKPLLDRLKNPQSARFRNEVIYDNQIVNSTVLCGEINAHNSYGAYTGYTPFVTYKNKTVSVNTNNKGLVSILCKNTSIDEYPGASVSTQDPSLALARNLVKLQLKFPDMAIFKDDSLINEHVKNSACGKVNYPYPTTGYIGFRDYITAGSSSLILEVKEDNALFTKFKELFCKSNTKHENSFGQWHIFSQTDDIYLASIQDKTGFLLSCHSNKPQFYIYTSKAIFVNKDKIFNKSINKQYTAISNNLNAISVNLKKKSGKKFLPDFAANKNTTLKTGYNNEHKYDTTGFIDAMDVFINHCTDYNWKKNWISKINVQ